jgi:hypothetical protein
MNRSRNLKQTLFAGLVVVGVSASRLAHAENRAVHWFYSQDDRAFTADGDWDFGAAKGECGGNAYAVAGVASGQPVNCGFGEAGCRGEGTIAILCTSLPFGVDQSSGYTRFTGFAGDNRADTIWGDWAYGFTKLECAETEVVTGIAQDFGSYYGTEGMLTEAIRCSPRIDGFVAQNCASRDFRYGDNRETTIRGDWAYGYMKGECGQGRFVKGIATHYRGDSFNDQLGARTLYVLCCS